VRVVILGAGGIGGTIGARLHQAGHDVALIARGSHLTAIREHGLTLETPEERVTLRIAAYGHPREVDWRQDDVVVHAAKSQDTERASNARRGPTSCAGSTASC
jgi:2-dehydropantoate 2-reductase